MRPGRWSNVVGLAAFSRVLQSGIEDFGYAIRI